MKYALGQTVKLDEQQDGMDMSLIVIDCDTKQLQFFWRIFAIVDFQNQWATN